MSPDFHVVLPHVVGCLLKTWLTKGGVASWAPQDPPGNAPAVCDAREVVK